MGRHKRCDLKELEVRAISGFVCDGMHVLDVGCGNGITAISLANNISRGGLESISQKPWLPIQPPLRQINL